MLGVSLDKPLIRSTRYKRAEEKKLPMKGRIRIRSRFLVCARQEVGQCFWFGCVIIISATNNSHNWRKKGKKGRNKRGIIIAQTHLKTKEENQSAENEDERQNIDKWQFPYTGTSVDARQRADEILLTFILHRDLIKRKMKKKNGSKFVVISG